jgi:AcrR family transcriptional regulator
MALPDDRRTRKRLATRQNISDMATRLFMERGFDRVSIDDIAAAADVARKTVFNHFARKEDMFFDLDALGREDLMAALAHRDAAVTLPETLRRFAHRAVAEQRPYIRFFEGSLRFMETIRGSGALQARAREMRDELAQTLAGGLAAALHRDGSDPLPKLAAAMIMAAWSVAFVEAHRIYQAGQDENAAAAAFLDIVDRGSAAVEAMLAAPA